MRRFGPRQIDGSKCSVPDLGIHLAYLKKNKETYVAGRENGGKSTRLKKKKIMKAESHRAK